VGFAFLAGCFAANLVADHYRGGALSWRPERLGWHWLLWVAALAVVVEWAARRPDVPALAGWMLRALMAGHAAWLLVPTGLREEPIWSVPAFAIVVFVEWGVLSLLATQLPGAALPFGAALSFFAAAAILIHAHTARMTDVATLIAAAFVGLSAVAWWARLDCGPAMPAAAIMLPGLLLSGYYETYSEIPSTSFLVAGLIPVAPVLCLASPFARLRSPVRRMLFFVLLLAPAAVAVALAMQAESLPFE